MLERRGQKVCESVDVDTVRRPYICSKKFLELLLPKQKQRRTKAPAGRMSDGGRDKGEIGSGR